jgi:hypothetical protein
MMKWIFRVLVPAMALTAFQAAQAAPGCTYSLFDGKTFDGWNVLGCEAAIENGEMVITAGNGIVQTDYRYRDFVLELDWKAEKAQGYDSGIYFRYTDIPKGSPWPGKYQANLLEGQEGGLVGFEGACKPELTRKGEWNHFKLTVVGTSAKLEFNGQPAWEADGIEVPAGFIGIQAEVPKGGVFRFKNITITELDFESMFDGETFSGFEGADGDASECWAIEDGILIGKRAGGTWLRSKEQYDDFNFRIQYKVEKGANSGDHHGEGAGIEVQVIDDNVEGLQPYQHAGSLYAVTPAQPNVAREPGSWNSFEINCNKDHWIVYHNGVKVIDTNPEKEPIIAERNLKGYFGLQNHGGGVAYRNIRIGAPID